MKNDRENTSVEDKPLDSSVFHKNMCWQRSYEKPAEEEMIMALYGSLRDGLYNSRRFALPEKSEFLGTARVEGYALYSLGAYPAVYP
ncbi:MAG: gamma-glutamylcyclotransferase, partial [Methanosarcinaceae archaeon]|nr:gamma-glutamylcyclotransferase [Methanosarcinaceae archaeon]